VLSEPLAASNLAGTVTALRDQGVFVFLYPLAIELTAPRLTANAFEFALTGPPGVYLVLVSTNLGAWSELGAVTNQFGTAVVGDVQSNPSARKFYRGLLQKPACEHGIHPAQYIHDGHPDQRSEPPA
jgi:hypothetical protein